MFEDRVADHTSTMIRRLEAAGGVQPGRPDHGQRVRRAQRQRHQAQRRHPQPVAARAHRRRVLGRIGRGGGRRAPAHRHRRRRRRLDPHPGRVLRPGRHEGHRRAHPPGARTDDRPAHRRGRAAWPARCATSPAGTTSAPATTPATLLQPPRIDGLGARPGTHDLRGPRRPSPRRWAARSSTPRSRSGRGRGEALARRRRPGGRRRAREPARARLRVGHGQPGAPCCVDLGDRWPTCKAT